MRGEDFVEVLGKNRHEPVEEPSEDQPKKNRSESVVRRTGGGCLISMLRG